MQTLTLRTKPQAEYQSELLKLIGDFVTLQKGSDWVDYLADMLTDYVGRTEEGVEFGYNAKHLEHVTFQTHNLQTFIVRLHEISEQQYISELHEKLNNSKN